jgi:hypothetical protein
MKTWFTLRLAEDGSCSAAYSASEDVTDAGGGVHTVASSIPFDQVDPEVKTQLLASLEKAKPVLAHAVKFDTLQHLAGMLPESKIGAAGRLMAALKQVLSVVKKG